MLHSKIITVRGFRIRVTARTEAQARMYKDMYANCTPVQLAAMSQETLGRVDYDPKAALAAPDYVAWGQSS